jgi:cardiolipin synthase A/B
VATWLTNVVWVLAGAAVAALYCILMQRRHVPHLRFETDSLPHIDRGLAVVAGLTRAAVQLGNRAQVLQNGAFFDALERDIRAARRTVHIESFVWTRGALETRFADLLCAKVREGVRVRLVIDAMGGIRASRQQLRRMRRCGVDLQLFCRLHWWNLRRLNHRSHRKIFVIDGEIGYTGGHGIADQWLGDGEDHAHWRDTAVRLEGPIVHCLQSVFMENFVWESQCVPSGEDAFPPLSPCGPVDCHAVSDSAGLAISSVALLYMVAIACARREVLIQNPYFAPDDSVVELFATVIKRGVAIQLMVPGENTDSPFVRRAGCHLYEPLLRAGVRIHEFQPTLIHQKVVIVDGVWSHVGSTNFDSRSLKLNEEVGIGLLDQAVAGELGQAFADDLQRCRELTLEQWSKRSGWSRLVDWLVYQVHDQL